MALAGFGVVTGTLCAMGYGHVVLACPLGTAQTFLAAREVYVPLLLGSLGLLVLAAALGRVFCSWICPQGLISEAADRLRAALPRVPLGADSDARHRRGRMVLLSVLAVGLASTFFLGVPVLCYICPVGIVCRAFVSSTWLGVVGALIVIVLLIVAVEMTLARRGWCRYVCPLGAVYGMCATPRTLRVTRNPKACVGCGSCEADCPMGCSPLKGKIRDTCTNCMACVDSCPEDALKLAFRAPPRRHR